MQIITNNQPRVLIDWCQLSEKEKADMDYLDSDDSQSGASFFRYKGRVYDLGEFLACRKEMEFGKWDGYSSDSFFSCILIRLLKNDPDRVIVGRFYA